MTAPIRPRLDPYGNPVPEQPWRGMTLDDIMAYAQTGQPVSTVREGGMGYGLDEVGNASTYRPEAKGPRTGPDWKQAVGAALAGIGSTQPGAGLTNVGRGFLTGTQYSDEQDQNTRRNALTESQIQYQQGRNDLNQLEILDYPQEQARKAEAADANRKLLETRVAAILAGEERDAEMLPYNIDVKKAQAANYRETSGGRQPVNREDWIANKAAALMARAQYDEDGYRTAGLDAQDAIRMASELWETTHSGPAPAGPRIGAFGGVYTPAGSGRGSGAPAASGGGAAAGPKEAVSQVEYDAIVEDMGADYAAQHFTVAR